MAQIFDFASENHSAKQLLAFVLLQRSLTKNLREGFMIGVIRFIFTVIWFALALGAVGTLIDATVFMKEQAAKSYIRRGISHKWWNDKLQSTK